jgi:hypothetical protein
MDWGRSGFRRTAIVPQAYEGKPVVDLRGVRTVLGLPRLRVGLFAE